MQPNILVIRLSSLGDIVLTAPVYKNLKAHWPDCRIAVLVKPQYVPVLEGHPCIDEVVPFYGLWSAVKWIRNRHFTHLLDLHSNLRSFFLRRFSGIPQVARYQKDALARRLFVTWGRRNPALTKHTIDRYLESLSAWNVPTPSREVHFGDYASDKLSGKTPERILVVQTAFLGDATLTVPLTREIKTLLPDSHLTILCRPDTAEIFRSSRWVDNILIDDKRGVAAGLGGFFALSRQLKDKRFDLAIVPHRSFRSALLVCLAGIPRRLGFSSSAGRFLFTRTIPFTWGMHDLDRNLGLLLPFRKDGHEREAVDSVYLTPKISKNGPDGIGKRLAEAGVKPGSLLIGVHPGSVWPTKRWPADRYSALIGRLAREANATIVLVGGPNDRELSASITQDSGVPVIDWTGQTTLAELIDLMQHLSLFITNDSGPMHVATASGVPTLAIFGPTTRELGFFPYGRGHRVLEVDLACRPCGLHGSKACPEGHFLCMRLIGVHEVYRTATEMLKAVIPAPPDISPRTPVPDAVPGAKAGIQKNLGLRRSGGGVSKTK